MNGPSYLRRLADPDPDPNPPEEGDAALDADTWGVEDQDPWAVLNQPGVVMPPERGQRLSPNPKAKVLALALEQVIGTVRKEIGWLEAELAFTWSKRKRARGKAARRRGRIRRRFGLQSSQLNVRRLRVLLERQRSLLRVKVLQRHRAKRLERRQRERTSFGAQGPKCLKEGVRLQAPTRPQARETTRFWRKIWGTEGQGDTTHSAFTDWAEWAKERARPYAGKS